MEVELWSGSTKAIIDPKGAWLTNLSDEYGDLLFPKRSLTAADGSEKLRGGSHVCLPNFGPGGKSGQPQHGFGRLEEWEVSDKTDNSILLTLEKGEDEYAKMSSVLTYQLDAQALLMTLELVNNGDDALRVAPAFHPYFVLGREHSAALNDEKLFLEDLAEVQFAEGTLQTLNISDTIITLESEELTTWAKWTDQLGPYVCVEPTLGGNAFLNDSPEPRELITSGETRLYRFIIRWQR